MIEEPGDGQERGMAIPLRPGTVVVITGGTAGIGRATARAFAAAGCDVAVLARGQDGLDGTVADIEKAGRRGLGIVTDVADAEAVERAADRVEAELGPIAIWVNNAMASVFAPLTEISAQEFERATRVTYLGAVHGTMSALKRMRPRNAGHVIQVGSALAFRGIPLQAAYCGAKHAVIGFTESVITELRHDKSAVTVSMVQMPAVNTIQFDWVLSRLPHHPQPVPPIYEPEIPAAAILHVARHPHRRNMWVALPTVGTILGNRVMPKALDVYLGHTGVSGQQTAKDDHPPIGVNLWEPVAGDRGARGDFSDRAHARSAGLWLSTHRPLAGALAAGGVAALAGQAARYLRAAR